MLYDEVVVTAINGPWRTVWVMGRAVSVNLPSKALNNDGPLGSCHDVVFDGDFVIRSKMLHFGRLVNAVRIDDVLVTLESPLLPLDPPVANVVESPFVSRCGCFFAADLDLANDSFGRIARCDSNPAIASLARKHGVDWYVVPDSLKQYPPTRTDPNYLFNAIKKTMMKPTVFSKGPSIPPGWLVGVVVHVNSGGVIVYSKGRGFLLSSYKKKPSQVANVGDWMTFLPFECPPKRGDLLLDGLVDRANHRLIDSPPHLTFLVKYDNEYIPVIFTPFDSLSQINVDTDAVGTALLHEEITQDLRTTVYRPHDGPITEQFLRSFPDSGVFVKLVVNNSKFGTQCFGHWVVYQDSLDDLQSVSKDAEAPDLVVSVLNRRLRHFYHQISSSRGGRGNVRQRNQQQTNSRGRGHSRPSTNVRHVLPSHVHSGRFTAVDRSNPSHFSPIVHPSPFHHHQQQSRGRGRGSSSQKPGGRKAIPPRPHTTQPFTSSSSSVPPAPSAYVLPMKSPKEDVMAAIVKALQNTSVTNYLRSHDILQFRKLDAIKETYLKANSKQEPIARARSTVH